ncbi:mRNA decay activator protein ZFP36L1 isoform X1 [Osmerus eperlanus]|uniref:mRNA decay activator protein ZFP36L1 isoform X1 n=1 Tax=Osmerus eperlanus TaxID=29151 RepID=UPI002E11D033
MPLYALNQFLDLEEVMCKQLLSLDLRETTGPPGLPQRPIGYKKPSAPCSLSSLSSSSSPLCPDPPQPAALASSHWGQPFERCNRMSFWAERSVSMVETGSSSLGWASSPGEPKQPASLSPSPLSSSSTLLTSPTSSSSSSISSRYKTELCRTFAESGICKYGPKCQFAHGQDELRDLNRHPKYKTEPCRTFHTIGFCPYGIRCHFVHNNEDDLGPPGRPGPARTHRPPVFRHSFSFAGFPSAPALEPSSLPSPFLRTPSASPPAADITDLLSHAFQEEDCVFEPAPAYPNAQARDPRSQFLPSPDSACSLSPGTCLLEQSPPVGPTLGVRSLSYTSLSDQEGACSSASSMTGSDSSGTDSSGRRLPIFSQLSVPDDGFVSDACSASFFL